MNSAVHILLAAVSNLEKMILKEEQIMNVSAAEYHEYCRTYGIEGATSLVY